MTMIDHHPPPVPRDQRKNLLFHNRGKDTIRITYLRFQSDVHPRDWDTIGDDETMQSDSVYYLPICGTGEIFIKWKSGTEERADHFTVLFDPNGHPYPYIFGGDRWTMALRHAALRATAENGDN